MFVSSAAAKRTAPVQLTWLHLRLRNLIWPSVARRVASWSAAPASNEFRSKLNATRHGFSSSAWATHVAHSRDRSFRARSILRNV